MLKKEDLMIAIRYYVTVLMSGLIVAHIQTATVTYGVVVVPVADLMGEQLKNSSQYGQLPLSGQGEPWRVCPRIHQLLFNEVVIIEKKENKQYCIRTPQLFFITPSSRNPMNLYWTHQDNVLPLDMLTSYKVSPDTIPQPLGNTAGTGHTNNKAQEIITLTSPFYDPITHLTFSAGTHFVLADTAKEESTYVVWAFDRRSKYVKKINIPKNLCYRLENNEPPRTRIKKFVQLLTKWAHLENGFIPYVWGGCSFQLPHTLDELEIIKNNHHDQPEVEIVVYKKKHNTKAKDGCDCAGLVLLAAQSCGIPYFLKNTYTLSHYLKPVEKNINPGDLIWIRGHVLIVADTEKNTIIEARDFSDGYGKIHEIALNKVFKDMNSFDDLMAAYREQKPLLRLNHPLGKTKEYDSFKILSLESVWQLQKPG